MTHHLSQNQHTAQNDQNIMYHVGIDQSHSTLSFFTRRQIRFRSCVGLSSSVCVCRFLEYPGSRSISRTHVLRLLVDSDLPWLVPAWHGVLPNHSIQVNSLTHLSPRTHGNFTLPAQPSDCLCVCSRLGTCPVLDSIWDMASPSLMASWAFSRSSGTSLDTHSIAMLSKLCRNQILGTDPSVKASN